MWRTVTFLIVFCKNEFIQGNIVRIKKETTKSCNKLSMYIKLLVEFTREKYNLNYKSHVYKIKTMHKLLQIPI